MVQQQPLSQRREQRLAPQIQKGGHRPRAQDRRSVEHVGLGAASPLQLPASTLKGKGTEVRAKPGCACGEPGSRAGRHRLSAPADTHQLRRVLPFQSRRSLRGGKDSCRRARKAAFEAAAGSRQGAGWGWGCLLPSLWLTGSPCGSDIMDENQVWLSNVGAAPPSSAWPAGPSQNGISFVSCLL